MKNFIYSTKRIIAVAIFSFVSLITVNAQTNYNPLAPALGFNVFTSKDFTATAGTIQGPAAIGRNLILQGSTNFTNNNSGIYPTNMLNSGNNYGIVIEGKIQFVSGNSSYVNNGFLRLKNTAGSTIYYVDNNNNPANLRVTAGSYNSNPQISLQKQQPSPTATDSSNINFTTAIAQLTTNSNKISVLSTGSCPSKINNITIPAGQNPHITLVSNKINIISLTDTSLNNLQNLIFDNNPASDKIVIFNVSTPGTYSWTNTPNFGGVNEQDGSYIIWNFYNTTVLNIIGSNAVYGTILAPNADINKTSSNNIDGQVISKSLIMGAGQLNYYTFAGLLPDCPTSAAGPLALSNIDYTAMLTGQNVKINLTILKEEIGDTYEIQRSIDGIGFSTFKKLTLIDGINGKYVVNDNVAFINSKNAYYRIIVLGTNRITYSDIKLVKITFENNISVWPVPAIDVLNVSFQSTSNTQGILQIFDTKGNVLSSTNYAFIKGNNLLSINNINGLPKGNYLLKIVTPEEKPVVKQFVKL